MNCISGCSFLFFFSFFRHANIWQLGNWASYASCLISISFSCKCVTLRPDNHLHYPYYNVCILQLFAGHFAGSLRWLITIVHFAWSHLVRFASALITSATGVILTGNGFLCANFIINTLYYFFPLLFASLKPSIPFFTALTFKHCFKNLAFCFNFKCNFICVCFSAERTC